MEESQIWPPPSQIDSPQIPQKPHWSVWDWMGIILAIVVLGPGFLANVCFVLTLLFSLIAGPIVFH